MFDIVQRYSRVWLYVILGGYAYDDAYASESFDDGAVRVNQRSGVSLKSRGRHR